MNKDVEVSYACLHDSIFVPGAIGNIGPTLSAGAEGKTKDLKMWLTSVDSLGTFLKVDIKGVFALIPIHNVKITLPKK